MMRTASMRHAGSQGRRLADILEAEDSVCSPLSDSSGMQHAVIGLRPGEVSFFAGESKPILGSQPPLLGQEMSSPFFGAPAGSW